jgi:phosphohistidine phosphatase
MSKEESPERPLSDTGRREVSQVAELLGQMGVAVDRIVHSGKPRAKQTAEILAHTVLPRIELETAADLNPNDPVGPWVERVSRLNDDTMLVGHLPFMGKLASTLVAGPQGPNVVAFHAGSVACLERSDGGTWTIIAVVNPPL